MLSFLFFAFGLVCSFVSRMSRNTNVGQTQDFQIEVHSNTPGKPPCEVMKCFKKGLENYCQEKYDEAIEYFDAALKLDPVYSNALNNKGIVLRNLGKQEEAMDCFDRAISVNGEDKFALNGKGNILNDLKRYGEAITYFDKGRL